MFPELTYWRRNKKKIDIINIIFTTVSVFSGAMYTVHCYEVTVLKSEKANRISVFQNAVAWMSFTMSNYGKS